MYGHSEVGMNDTFHNGCHIKPVLVRKVLLSGQNKILMSTKSS